MNYQPCEVNLHVLMFFSCYDSSLEMLCGPDGELPEKLRNLEPRLIEHVSNEIMDRDPNVRWDDIGTMKNTKFPSISSFVVSVKFFLI